MAGDEILAAVAPEEATSDALPGSVGTEDEEIRAESRSRLRRFKSARTSVALWYRSSGSLSSNFKMIRSTSGDK